MLRMAALSSCFALPLLLALLLLTLGPLVYTPFATYLNWPEAKGLSKS
jgi:hypothetical protein